MDARTLAAIQRDWLEISGGTARKLLELQADSIREAGDATREYVTEFFAAPGRAELEKLQARCLELAWGSQLSFARAAFELTQTAWSEMQEVVEKHAPDATGEASVGAAVFAESAAGADAAPEPTAASAAFELYRDAAGEFRFRLKRADGAVLLASEGYKSRASAEKGIASVMKNAANDARYERVEAASGEPMFNLKAGNHQVIGTSRRYPSPEALEADVALLKAAAGTAETHDLTA